MCEVLERAEKRGRQRGEDDTILLFKKLFEAGRIEDVKKASENPDYLRQLMKEFSILPQ